MTTKEMLIAIVLMTTSFGLLVALFVRFLLRSSRPEDAGEDYNQVDVPTDLYGRVANAVASVEGGQLIATWSIWDAEYVVRDGDGRWVNAWGVCNITGERFEVVRKGLSTPNYGGVRWTFAELVADHWTGNLFVYCWRATLPCGLWLEVWNAAEDGDEEACTSRPVWEWGVGFGFAEGIGCRPVPIRYGQQDRGVTLEEGQRLAIEQACELVAELGEQIESTWGLA